jgi:hypothetical protein
MGEDQQRGQDLQEALLERVERLERENQRLRERLEPVLGPDNPCVDREAFSRAIMQLRVCFSLPFCLFFLLPLARYSAVLSPITSIQIGPVRLLDIGGIGTWHPGFGLGVVAIGGVTVGLVAVGGLAVGVLAVGGGSIGLVACGGGSIGLIAVGGGACGYIAIGGGAWGYYALGQKARGRYVLSLTRQDQEAIDLFVRWVPGLRSAVTQPMPVIPLGRQAEEQGETGGAQGRAGTSRSGSSGK